MSRTRKGSKGPGWEPWGNIRDKEQERLRGLERDAHDFDDGNEDFMLEVEDSLYCYLYGPCDLCLTRQAERGEADVD